MATAALKERPFADTEPSREPIKTTVQRGGGYRPDARMRGPALALSVAIPLALLAAMTYLHTNSVEAKRTKELLTFDVIAHAPPPAPIPDKPVDPVVPPKTELVAPPPEVQVPTPPRPVVATTQVIAPPDPTPAPPKAAAAAPAPPAPPGPLSVGNLTSKLISGAPPAYPVEARRKRETGTVVLRLVLSTEGRISSIVVYKSSGVALLDSVALDAVRKWRWSPTLRDGQPTEVTGLVQIPFILRNS